MQDADPLAFLPAGCASPECVLPASANPDAHAHAQKVQRCDCVTSMPPPPQRRRLQCVNMSQWQMPNYPQHPPGASACGTHISRHAESLPQRPGIRQAPMSPPSCRAYTCKVDEAQTPRSVGSSLKWLALAADCSPGLAFCASSSLLEVACWRQRDSPQAAPKVAVAVKKEPKFWVDAWLLFWAFIVV